MNNLKLVPTANDEAELRETLRSTIEQRDAATTIRDRARSVVDAAQAHLKTCGDVMAEFSKLDDEIAGYRARQIAESLESGGGLPTMAVSQELLQKSASRTEAANRYRAIEQASVQLRDNLAQAEEVLALHQANAATAARAVVAHRADAMAIELRALETEAGALRQKLLGATATRPGFSYPVSSETIKLLRDVPLNSLYNANSGANAKVFDGYLNRLLVDADAQFEE